MILPYSTKAQPYVNISFGSSLTARNDHNSSWQSPSGEFAFGFKQIGKDGFLLAIWFNKIPERTIVWSANGNNLVPQGSQVELTSDGQFMLKDATGKEYGLLILLSFDQPTDTILPTQILNQNSNLYARYTATNYSRGRFRFKLQSDGNLGLYTTNFPQDFANFNSAYWSVKTTDTIFQVIFNQSGLIYLASGNGSVLNIISSNAVSIQDFYQRATLEYDGVLRHCFYPKSTSSSAGRWPMAWSTITFLPPNICSSITEDMGGGACGFNSLCRLENEGRPICDCPHGYTFIDPNDVRKGYYEHFKGVTENWCRQNCLDDCFCAVAIVNSVGDCFKKRLPFSNGRIYPSYDAKALIKFGKDNSTFRSDGGAITKKKDNSTLLLVGSVLMSSSGVLYILLPLITYLVVSRVYSRKAKVNQPHPVMSGMNLKDFTYEELKKATNEFKEELGRGASATVFKGVLASDTGRCVAVKSLDAKVRENDLEFKAEVSAIGRTNHRNLVQLLGFCNEGEHRILVYEFMSNGSLASFLFGESMPNWYQRRQISLGIARGLLYLHEECSSQIVHCDIKPQNILLDDYFTARISDFGLAKLLRLDQTRSMTAIRGTRGYVAPEWFRSLPITVKVDVYSYGILLLEIIFCRKHFEAVADNEDEMILADWAYDCYTQKKLHRLFENDDEKINDINEMEKYVMIAIWCIQEDPSLRPTMKKVTLMLEGTVEVSAPPPPS
ncbi:G-type lectin S-receptor-like serine/threonine-protein kinase LECRK3 [Prunus yedoensis var. nudiflora]|uniref:non-specific serine/threonine protein kinase n=1 Tax=Prunus yedoensis var. nudiflora TaxID=2094558 RepID=A0A314Z9T0_PRUYE|nr:G-type lectin S-receptor-like serine/threonine-protein kinase LECRK3 [Prunus yedoensis var. nudiflora]